MYTSINKVENVVLPFDYDFREVSINNSGLSNLLDYIKRISRFNLGILLNSDNSQFAYNITKFIHYYSNRNGNLFTKFICNEVSNDLVDIELFGCEKGTYRNFPEGKKGIFEIYNDGTVYLEEISKLPLYAQYKLIDLIEEGILDKSGSIQKVKTDIKIIASTTKDLKKLIKEGLFIEGLYYSFFEIKNPF